MAKKVKKSKVVKKLVAKKIARKSAPRKTGQAKVPVKSVVQFVRMLHEEKHADEFITAAHEANAMVTLDQRGIDLVKNYLEKKQLRTMMRASIDDPCPDDPFDCKKS